MEQLDGKVAVVTGAARGIGAAISRKFVAEAMRVVVSDVDAAALDATAAELRHDGSEVLAVPTDVSDPAAVDALAAAARDHFGTVHVVCNNAGVGGHGRPTWDQPDREWEWVLGVNLLGVVHGIRSFVPTLLAQDEGHVVNTASLAGLLAIPYLAPYTATKHAVVGISTALFHELAFAGSQVGVSVLCPGFVRTDILDVDRAWPARLGASPGVATADPGAQAIGELFEQGVAGGLEPEVLGDLVVDAIRTKRFFVTTHPESAGLAAAMLGRVVEGAPPDVPAI